MNYYRKYRPQTVAELDLNIVRQALEQILTSGQFTHAYLFSGPKGTGKTSAARILAKILHCEKNQHVGKGQAFSEPCNKCEACKAITNGSHLGVIEMDAASNRGIDEIRALREKIGLAPAQGKFTVYVIDEVHMLTNEAFNALLKTLEEPPPHAVFILATTEKQKVPETIVSRCLEINFNRAKETEIIHSLNKAVAGEKLEIDTETITLIATRADGSFRDAMKNLEQAAQKGPKIQLKTVEELLGLGKLYDPIPFIERMLAGENTKAMQELKQKLEAGADASQYGFRLVEELRRQLIEMVMSGKNNLPLVKLTERITQAVGEMRQAPIAVLPLEIAIAEWEMGERRQEIEIKVPEKVTIKPTNLQPVKASGRQITLDEVKANWMEILKAVKPLNHSLEALLKSARPMETENNWLTIEVFYNFHKEQLEQERYRKMLEEKTTEVMGTPVKLRFVLGKRASQAAKASSEEVKNITGKVADEELAKAAEEIFG